MQSQKYFLAKKESLIRRFLYTGPALIVSIGYMDLGTDIQGGASLNYSLL
jgi:Mn2+/Fe2+ NRAMP family transporter